MSPSLKALTEALKTRSPLVIQSIWNSAKSHALAEVFKESKKSLLIITGGKREDRFIDNFPHFLNDEILELPAWETLPGEEIQPSPDILGKRFSTLHKIFSNKKPKIVLCPLQSLLQKLPARVNTKNLFLNWKIGQTVSFAALKKTLTKLGYVQAKVVSDKKEFAVRGGILDIFPISSPDPYRIEFFGDEIESIRTFDPVGQKSVEKTKEVFITPADELALLKEQESESLLDYVGENTILVFDDLLSLEDVYVSLKSMPGFASAYFSSIDEILERSQDLTKLLFTKERLEDLSSVKQGKLERNLLPVSFEMFGSSIEAHLWHHSYIKVDAFFRPEDKESYQLLDHLLDFDLPKLKLTFLYESDKYRENLESELSCRKIENYELKKGYLTSGFVQTDITHAIISESDIGKKQRVRRQKWRSAYHTPAAEFHELSPGDLVVHFHSGIGKYLGTEKQKNHLGVEAEFMLIEYAKNSKLYIPLSQAHLVSRYIGASESMPALSTIGSKRWSQVKTKAQKEIIGYASDLLHLYAERQLDNAFAHPEDSDETDEFEKDFPYVETPDQLTAITALKEDMGRKKPMDRLICGDVGYGKTEVAMRAAFKAVADGRKQVAVLVPTTVLAMQHYDTFKERMGNYPINIGVLSRFRTAKENKATIQKAEKGEIDIVIGTHRILSKDVTFKDLGLIIIDEEQRFGVRAKEHLKKLKKGAHSMTLSATPIPRTLYMSLISARDMSVINTPPQDRLPIKSIIAEMDDELITNAILREISREGQVFFIHNRVESIATRAKHIQKLVPQATVSIVHGQMPPDEVDKIFHRFKLGQVDILFATTIVESGIDVPNANTILIDRADAYGLADLYQLRGRVGRWNRAAYAYFLIPKQGVLSEIARKRLSALMEAGSYGGGMKVAMRDLEIRGAGDILGEKQSGQIASIGFHLYCKLLRRTIEAIKQQKPISFIETKMEFFYDASLPGTYIPESSLRMEIYHRIGEVMSLDGVDEIFKELKDRFGKPPKPVIFLYYLTRIRVFASQNNFTHLKFGQRELTAERMHGKKSKRESIFLSQKITSPKELEEVVITHLKKKFGIKTS